MRLEQRITAKVRALRALEEARTRVDAMDCSAGTDGYSRMAKRTTAIENAKDRVRGQITNLQAKLDSLRDACREAITEQGLEPCDVPWCGNVATHKWTLTPAEIKASRTRYKGHVQEALPCNVRCQTHVPYWRLGQYARFVQGANVESVA